MCGIVCAFETKNDSQLRPKVLEMAKKIRHRGPDWSGISIQINLQLLLMKDWLL